MKALQKLAVPDGRLLDFHEAKNRVEKLTAEVRGHERLEALRRWTEVGLYLHKMTLSLSGIRTKVMGSGRGEGRGGEGIVAVWHVHSDMNF